MASEAYIDAVAPASNDEQRERLYTWIAGRLADGMTKFLVHKTAYVVHDPVVYAVTIHCNQGMFGVHLKNDTDEQEADKAVRDTRQELFTFMDKVAAMKVVD